MITLQNDHIAAQFSLKGAELQSLRSKKSGHEYIWSGDADYWGKFSPVLFPIVGALKDNTYQLNGRAHPLPRHGFARERQFKAKQTDSTRVCFSLEQDEETLKVYPFEFLLELHYEIKGTQLNCTYIVNNPGTQDLLFSVGAHPAFATQTDQKLSYTDYFLAFDKDTELVTHKIESDLISDETRTLVLKNQSLPLSHELFYEDALVMKSLKSNRISLQNKKNEHGLHFDFEGFPFFGIWAARDADFVCLEPWCGIADGTHHNKNLKDKEGINQLAPGLSWERSWSVTIF